ncbi:MAG: winged helix-turn-helix domain-containing protein [Candidatus Auribacterota bacterium]|nr:winged helix-turn-helix domain-containing protein [Candidatus Auribacterota bacterium]
MTTLLTDFKKEYRDRLLGILWRQWTTLGVSGYGETWKGSVIDPEALLLFSCTILRYDARLFDAVLEWLRVNGRFINVQRTKRMLKTENFTGETVVSALAAVIKNSVHEAKWARLASKKVNAENNPEPLFFLKDGRPIPVMRQEDPLFLKYGFSRTLFKERGVALRFRPELQGNLLLRLRALLGVNARCEILAYLMLNDRGSPRAMARDCYYYPATVSKALADMSQSGYVVSQTEGRHRYYKLISDQWRDLLLGKSAPQLWVVWARLFSALEQVWLFLNRTDLAEKPPLVQSSALRRLLKDPVISQLNRAGLSFMFGNDSAYPAETLVPFFIERMTVLLDKLENR